MADLKTFINSVGKGINKNSSVILCGLGVAGVIGTTVLTVKVTKDVIKDMQKEGEKLSKKDIFKKYWKKYIPVAISGAGTITCVIASTVINEKKKTAMAGLYAASQISLKELKDKVKEEVGEKKAKEIEDKVIEDKVKRMPVEESYVIRTEGGNTLCMDEWSGRYFRSDMETIRKARNDANYKIINEFNLSLNEFYMILGLPPIPMGDEMGWESEYKIDLKFTSTLTDRGEPVLVVGHNVPPSYI